MELKKYKKILEKIKEKKEAILKQFDLKKIKLNLKNLPVLSKKEKKDIEDMIEAPEVKPLIESIIKELKITENEEIFAIYNSIFNLIVDELFNMSKNNLSVENYLSSKCPFCDSDFQCAFIDEDGKKFLVCTACSNHWRYPRIKCPYCETEDQKKLSYIEFEDIDYFRFYECDECGKFHKVFLIEKLKTNKPLKELDIETKEYDIGYEQNK